LSDGEVGDGEEVEEDMKEWMDQWIIMMRDDSCG